MTDIIEQAIKAANTPIDKNIGRKNIFASQMKVKSFDKPVTVSEAIQECGADYKVIKKPIYYDDDNGERQQIDSHCITAIDGGEGYLGVVGTNYGIVQNEKAFEFINILTSGELYAKEKPVIETAGILNNGAQMFVTAKIPTKFRIDGDDAEGIDDYLCFTNSHNGSSGVMAYFTPIRVVCENTLNASIRGAINKLSLKHTSRVNERLDFTNSENMQFALRVMNAHNKFKEAFVEDLMRLKQIKIGSNTDIDKFCAAIFADEKEMLALQKNGWKTAGIDPKDLSKRKSNLIDNLKMAVYTGIGQSQHKGTGLNLYNGVTTYINNYANFGSDEARFHSVMTGDAQKKVQRAHDLILQMA